MRALAQQVAAKTNLPVVEKNLVFYNDFRKRAAGNNATLAGLEVEKSSALRAPWPKMIIAISDQCAPVACWVKEQSLKNTKLVHLGRPRKSLYLFDLVVSTPQFRLPPAENHIEISLPLTLASPPMEEARLSKWRETFKNMPRPLRMVCIGGEAKRLVTDSSGIRRLLELVVRKMKRSGGSLVVLTSPRTPPKIIEEVGILLHGDRERIRFYPWGKGRPNPYSALLTLADEIITTNDSASMPADAIYAEKPLWLYEFPRKENWTALGWMAKGKINRMLCERRDIRFMAGKKPDFIDRGTEALIRHAWLLPRRNVQIYAHSLYKKNLARPLSTEDEPAWGQPDRGYKSELSMVANRAAELLH